MKFDELKRKYSDITGPYYGYNEVNEAIEELQNENAELKQKLEDAKADAAETLALLEERNRQVGELTENERRLKRALWLARVERAQDKQTYYTHTRGDGWVHGVDQWIEVERKCLKKAEEYK